MKKRLFAGALLLLVSFSAHAELESWYTYWGLGLVNNSYPEVIEENFSDIEKSPSGDRSSLGLDMLGFYWPVSDNDILGFVLSSTSDIGEMAVNNSKVEYSVTQVLYGLSGMKFFGKEVGDGFFIRADLGYAVVVETRKISGVGETEGGESGFGALASVGYGIPVSEDSRVLLSAGAAMNKFKGDDFTSIRFSVGGLW